VKETAANQGNREVIVATEAVVGIREGEMLTQYKARLEQDLNRRKEEARTAYFRYETTYNTRSVDAGLCNEHNAPMNSILNELHRIDLFQKGRL
jgi:hypothetical protein